MTKTNLEKRTFQKLKCDDLKINLNQIIEATNKIWSNDAPKLIDNFTDHGLQHSRRVLENVTNLLRANNGKSLSDFELYVLLASIYLHDIGMQCDILKHPDIKRKAEILGANFDISFNSVQSSDLSQLEQDTIRKNHSFLSAAWIDYANKSGETVLGQAAQNIPQDLVDDLIDICRFHSSLPIHECEKRFNYYPLYRKQYLAALLRLADELDIDRNRISLDTVKTYRIAPRNALFWWLHNRTHINFINKYLIRLFVTLNEEDFEVFAEYLNNKYVAEFNSKNYQTLIVLAEHDNPIFISTIPGILINPRNESFPQEIKMMIQNEMKNREMRKKEDKIDEAETLLDFTSPAIIHIIPDCVFRQSNPAVVGVRVLMGVLKSGVGLINESGKKVGRVKAMQLRQETIHNAEAGLEVAISIEGVTIGRQIVVGENIYVDIPEKELHILLKNKEILDKNTQKLLDKIQSIKMQNL